MIDFGLTLGGCRFKHVVAPMFGILEILAMSEFETDLVSRAFSFGALNDAFDAMREFDGEQEVSYQYEVNGHFDGERCLIGWHIRVKDMDGFGVGYVGLL